MREREREKERERDRERETDTQTDTQTETERERDRDRETETETERDRERQRQRDDLSVNEKITKRASWGTGVGGERKKRKVMNSVKDARTKRIIIVRFALTFCQKFMLLVCFMYLPLKTKAQLVKN